LTITFSPDEAGDFEGVLTIVSNDEDNAEVAVDLSGRGIAEVPHIVVSDDVIDFGDLLIGDSAESSLTISNDGNADLIIGTVDIAGNFFSSDFDEEVTIEPAGEFNINLTFSPEEEGEFAGRVTIISNDPEQGEVEIDMMGVGLTPEPQIEIGDGGGFDFQNDEPYLFGDVLVDTDREWEFEVGNSGDALLDVSLSVEGDGFSVEPAEQIDIAVGENATITVTFSPNEVAEFSGVLQLDSNDPENGRININLRGFGVEDEIPHIVINQDVIDFGEVQVDEGRVMELTGRNIGAGVLQIQEINIEGDAFSVEFDAENGLSVEPGAGFSFPVTFEPTEFEDYEGQLTVVSDDDDNGELVIDLMGIGADLVIHHFEFEVTDENMSAIIEEAILNGESLVEGDEIGAFTQDGICGGAVMIGADDGELFPVGLTLWADDNFTEEIEGFQGNEEISWLYWDAEAESEFEAFAEYAMGRGVYQANGLIILSLDANNEEIPRIRIVEEEHDFGRVLLNAERIWTMEISNLGDANLVIENIVADGNGFEVRGIEDNAEVAPQESVQVDVVFLPAEVGDYEGNLIVNSNDPANPRLEIALMGEGLEPADPAIDLSEMDHDFGEVLITEVAEWELTIINIGADVLTIEDLELDGDGFAIDQENGFDLDIDESLTITVSFAPDDVTDFEATLVVRSNDPENEVLEVSLVGMGIIPEPRWEYVITDVSMSILVREILLDFDPIAIGGQVGVFTEGDLCAGVSFIAEYPLGLAAWGDDAETEVIDGFEAGQELFFRVWDEETETEMLAVAEYIEGDRVFEANAVSVINLEVIPPEGFVHFHGVIETDTNHSLLVGSAEMERGVFLEAGDEVGVITPDGILAGAIVLEDDGDVQFGIAAFGDDRDTEEIDGFRDGEEFSFIYWDSDSRVEIQAQADWLLGDRTWVANGFSRLLLELVGANHPPQWVNIPEIVEGLTEELVEFTIEGMDRDDNDVVITGASENLPDGWELEDHNDGTATFTWTPSNEETGEYTIELTISDDEFDIVATVDIVIDEGNRPPVAEEIEDVEIEEDAGETVLFDLDDIFSDPDGDDLTFDFAADDQLGMSLDDENVLRIDTADDINGEFEVTLTADDGRGEGRVMGVIIGGGLVAQILFVNNGNLPPVRDDEIGVTFMITVTPVNDAPFVAEAVEDVEVDEDAGETVLIADISEVFADIDGDDLEYSFDGDEVLNLALENNRLTMNPDEHYNGESEVTVSADDEQDRVAVIHFRSGNQASSLRTSQRSVRSVNGNANHNPHRDESVDDVFMVTVNAINDDPLWIDPPEDFQVDEGNELQFNLTAGDFDFLFEGEEDLELVMTEDDGTGANFADNDDNTGTFIWDTGFRDAGQYNVTFEVSDQAGATAEISVEITVNNVEQIPEIVDPTDEDVFDVQVEEGQEVLIEFGAEDDDNDEEELTWTIDPEELPDDWTFDDVGDGTAEFFVDTNNDQAGDYQFNVTVTDPDGNEDEILINVTVLDVNRVLAFVQPTDQDEYDHAGDEGEEMRFAILAVDPDGDDIEYSFDELLALPNDPEIVDNGDGSFDFVWTPPFDGGDRVHDALIIASDGNDEDELLIHINVADVNRNPIIDAPIDDVVMQEDDAPLVVADLDDVFSDPDGDALRFETEGAPAGVTIGIDDENVLTIAIDADFNLPDGADITVRAIEVDFNLEVEDVFNLIIEPFNDAPGVFALLSPEDGSVFDRENWDWSIAFEWEAADDIDSEVLTYSFYIQVQFEDIDSTLAIDELDNNAYTITRLDTILAGMGIIIEDDLSIEVSWWAEADDGELATESSERWTLTLPIPNAVGDLELITPEDYSLSPVYPNPFNPSANISFSLPVNSMVNLSVWNLEGRKVSQMIDQSLSAGVHNVRWMAHDTPAGVYIFLLEVNGQRITTKGVLVK